MNKIHKYIANVPFIITVYVQVVLMLVYFDFYPALFIIIDAIDTQIVFTSLLHFILFRRYYSVFQINNVISIIVLVFLQIVYLLYNISDLSYYLFYVFVVYLGYFKRWYE